MSTATQNTSQSGIPSPSIDTPARDTRRSHSPQPSLPDTAQASLPASQHALPEGLNGANGLIAAIMQMRQLDKIPAAPPPRGTRKRKSPPDAAAADHQQPPPPPAASQQIQAMPVMQQSQAPPMQFQYPPSGDYSAGGMPPPHLQPQSQQNGHHSMSPEEQGSAGSRQLSTSKRAEQNRKAQRAFRERRDQHVKALESRSQLLDAALASADEANRRWEECRALVDQLRIENAALRSALQQAQMAVGNKHMEENNKDVNGNKQSRPPSVDGGDCKDS